MKKILTFILITMELVSCKNEPATVATKTEPPATKDQKEIEKLVRDMYYWVEHSHDTNAFRPFVKDSMVVGYDQIAQSLYVINLKHTGYFTEGFINNTNKIFKTQDELLRSDNVEWYEDEQSPFHGDSNQWCNCQDGELEDITLHFDNIEATTATFYWNWEGQGDPSWANHHYHMRAVKEKGKWKVDYMEGWDYEANVSY